MFFVQVLLITVLNLASLSEVVYSLTSSTQVIDDTAVTASPITQTYTNLMKAIENQILEDMSSVTATQSSNSTFQQLVTPDSQVESSVKVQVNSNVSSDQPVKTNVEVHIEASPAAQYQFNGQTYQNYEDWKAAVEADSTSQVELDLSVQQAKKEFEEVQTEVQAQFNSQGQDAKN